MGHGHIVGRGRVRVAAWRGNVQSTRPGWRPALAAVAVTRAIAGRVQSRRKFAIDLRE